MSFEVFVQCFRDGEPAGLPRRAVREAFGTFLEEMEPNLWQLRYDKKNSCEIFLTPHQSDADLACGFTVQRPCKDARLWDALATVLGLGNVVMYFPGCRAPLVKDKVVTRHLPSELIDGLGKPVVVASGWQIRKEVESG